MARQFGHKALAETHHLCFRLAFWVKIGAALAAAHGKCGQSVFEDLFKAQEFDNGKIDVVPEAQTALVRANGRIELDAVGSVDLNLPLIVYPGNPKQNGALRFHQAADDILLFNAGILLHHGDQRFQNLINSFQKFCLFGITGNKFLINAIQIRVFDGHK